VAWRIDNWSEALAVFTRRDLISHVFFRPMLNLSFFLNASLGHNSIMLYHLVNVTLHLLGGCLFLALLRRLRFSDRLSLACALVFVAHPALTQAAAWIPGRTESLAAIFILLSFINFVACQEDHRPKQFVSHHLFLLAALLAKEVSVVLPVVCGLYALLVRRKKLFDAENICFAVGWFMMLAVWLGLRFHGLHGEPGLGQAYDLPKLISNLPVMFHYLGRVVWPVQPLVLPGPEALHYRLGIIAAIILVVLLFFTAKRSRGLGWFGLFWFGLFVLPGLVVANFFFEYRLYVPLMGILMALAVTPLVRKLEERPVLFWAVSAVIILGLSALSLRHMTAFRDKISYWESAAQGQPGSAFIQNSLGAAYQMEGEVTKAVEQYRQVLKINPYEPIVHNNLGLIAASRGDYQAALREYQMEIAVNPGYPNVYLNLGGLYFALGENRRAEDAWQKARDLNPQDLRAVKSLIKLYLETGENAKAQALMDELRGRIGGN
jgi:tetratricopeptide (TPR) repeat protein